MLGWLDNAGVCSLMGLFLFIYCLPLFLTVLFGVALADWLMLTGWVFWSFLIGFYLVIVFVLFVIMK